VRGGDEKFTPLIERTGCGLWKGEE